MLILEECEKISKMQGEVEIDESYFGPKRIHGKRRVFAINEKTLKIDKETNEYAGILSYAFNVGLKSREYLFRECNKDNNNRFLSFFTLRYGVNFVLGDNNSKYGIAKRRFWESELFGFEYDDKKAFKLAIGIFKILNFKYKPRKKVNQDFVTKFQKDYPNQTHLNWILKYENDLLYANKTTSPKQTWQKFYNQDAIANNLDTRLQNIQGITPNKDNILSPYLSYLNTLTQKTFNLENIYCIQSFYGVLGAHKLDNVAILNKILNQRFSHNNTNQTNDASSQSDNPDSQTQQENLTQILILYPKATPLPIQIIQPENTFLTLVVGKNAKLDCSKLLLDKCEIHYLQYDENQEESTENPKITALKTDSKLTLTTKDKDSNLYEVIHNGIIYYISKNDGVLRVALEQSREEVIELHNFARENKYKILKESYSQMLDIQLKLQDNKELPTSHNGNFTLTINNLTLLNKNRENLDITEDYTLYLHNCENRMIYENTSIQKNTDNTYCVEFKFDLIQDEDSNFFKRTTKLIIATQNLSNDFSTSEIHTKGNVAIVSLSSADKKGGNYTFTKKVSAQEFGGEIKTIYVDNDNPKAYQKQIDDSKKDLNIIDIKAYSNKEQTKEIDTYDTETTIFVRAILNEEDKAFYDETIHWAYYIKGASEDLNKINTKKVNQMENIEGNDITFSLNMLTENDKKILLESLQDHSQKYELILFAYFKKPAIQVGNNNTSIVLSVKASQ